MNLYDCILAKGYTATSIAKVLGIHKQAVYSWRDGNSFPNKERSRALEKLLGVENLDVLRLYQKK